jgi:predicted hydrolase (HD superfamily)
LGAMRDVRVLSRLCGMLLQGTLAAVLTDRLQSHWPYTRAMRIMPSVMDAERLAQDLLEPLPDRWAHVKAVAARADGLTPAIVGEDCRQLLVVAAWWHDLGYAPALRDTGAHQIDGARYLAAEGYPDRLVALVAHHSAATCEAEERGHLADLEVWPREESAVADALWMADMTTGPRGEELAYDQRLSEILDRYEPDSIVGRSMLRAEPAIRAAIDRTRQRMQDAYTI